MRTTRLPLIVALVAATLTLTADTAKAQTNFTATTGGTYSWNSPGNWDAAIPNASGASANFPDIMGFGSFSVTLNSAPTIGSLTITNNGSSSDLFTLSNGSGGPLTFDNSGTAFLTVSGSNSSTNHVTIGSDLSLTNTLQIANNTPGTIQITGNISGSGGLINAGTGAVTLTGANTYSGATTINAGTLTVSSTGALGSGPLAVNNLNTGSSTDVFLNVNASQTVGSLSGIISAPSDGNTAQIVLGSGANLTVIQTTDATFAGSFSGSGSLTLGSGSTNTLTLTGTNQFGGLNLNGGILSVASLDNLGATREFPYPLTFDGGTLRVDGTFRLSDGSIGSVTINAGGATFDVTSGNTVTVSDINSVVLPLTPDGSLTKIGDGTIVLGGINNYSGNTRIKSGMLTLTGAIDNTPKITVYNGAVFNVTAFGSTGFILGGGGTPQTLRGLGAVNGNITVSPDSIVSPGHGTTVGTLTINGKVDFSLGGTLAIRINSSGDPAATGTGGSSTGASYSFLTITGGGQSDFTNVVISIHGSSATFANSAYSYKIATGAGDQHLLNVNSLDNPAQFVADFSGFTFSLTGNNTGDVFLNFTPVPEPVAVLGIAVGALAVGGFVRRRLRKPTLATEAADAAVSNPTA